MRDGVRGRLAAEVRETVPRAPGVYAFMDDVGRLLYVGKSVNLRQRVASYFRRNPTAAEPHLGQLVASIGSFAWWETRSELLALLLEDAMIKEYLPPYNTRQREFRENRYLELTDTEFPSCLIVEHAQDFGAREVFGPMKDRYFAERLRDILRESLGIRGCSEPEPDRRCLEHDIGRCAGPCRGVVEPAEYRELVSKARDFLSGNADEVLEGLVAARDRAAASRCFEDAARLRDAIETCRRYEARERFARRFRSGDCLVSDARGGLEYHFEEGALMIPEDVVVASGRSVRYRSTSPERFDPEDAGRVSARALRRPAHEDARFLADRARVVESWCRRSARELRVRFSDDNHPAPGART
jgi:excinuclease UvrABC nuclease subunit